MNNNGKEIIDLDYNNSEDMEVFNFLPKLANLKTLNLAI